jgi:biopolymer transport protein ExbD
MLVRSTSRCGVKRMAFRFQSAQSAQRQLDLIPLISVIFLLLIFFLIAGSLRPPTRADLTPPLSSSQDALHRGQLHFQIDAEGRIRIGDRRMKSEGVEQAIADAQSSNDTLKITIEADASVDSHHVIRLMERLRAAGVREVQLVTLQPERAS